MQKQLLFVCTGNFYRSRFAEAIFNFHAHARNLPWRAFSRGLGIHFAPPEDISPFTLEALDKRGIELSFTGPTRVQLSLEDLKGSARVIALKETEHRPMMNKLFPEWESRITYWEEHDLDVAHAEEALPKIEAKVMRLVEEVQVEGASPHAPSI